jgi:hypothetical protein
MSAGAARGRRTAAREGAQRYGEHERARAAADAHDVLDDERIARERKLAQRSSCEARALRTQRVSSANPSRTPAFVWSRCMRSRRPSTERCSSACARTVKGTARHIVQSSRWPSSAARNAECELGADVHEKRRRPATCLRTASASRIQSGGGGCLSGGSRRTFVLCAGFG